MCVGVRALVCLGVRVRVYKCVCVCVNARAHVFILSNNKYVVIRRMFNVLCTVHVLRQLQTLSPKNEHFFGGSCSSTAITFLSNAQTCSSSRQIILFSTILLSSCSSSSIMRPRRYSRFFPVVSAWLHAVPWTRCNWVAAHACQTSGERHHRLISVSMDSLRTVVKLTHRKMNWNIIRTEAV